MWSDVTSIAKQTIDLCSACIYEFRKKKKIKQTRFSNKFTVILFDQRHHHNLLSHCRYVGNSIEHNHPTKLRLNELNSVLGHWHRIATENRKFIVTFLSIKRWICYCLLTLYGERFRNIWPTCEHGTISNVPPHIHDLNDSSKFSPPQISKCGS